MSEWLRANRIEITAALLYAALYAFFWPVLYTTMDESAYLNYAYVYRQGTVYADVAGISAVQSYPVGAASHIVTLYPPGMSVLLALVSVFDWGVTLGLNLIVHIAAFFVLAYLLRRNHAPSWLAFLYLLHPTAVIFSHTMMSDPLSGLLILLAFAACGKRRFAVAGLLIGLSVFVRTANGVAAGFFAIGLALEAAPAILTAVKRGEWAKAFRGLLPAMMVALSAVPFLVATWLFQKCVQDGGWARYSGKGLLGLQHFPHMFPAYTLALLVVFPGMLFAPLFYRGKNRSLLLTLCYGFLLFYSCYYYQDSTGSRLESFVVGQRFMLAVLPLYLLAYGDALNRFFGRLWKRATGQALAAFVAVVLFGVAGYGIQKHQTYLLGLKEVRDTVAAQVPADALFFCNVHVAKLLHPAWTGVRKYTMIGNYHDVKADTAAAEKALRAAFASGAKEAYLAVWSRDYRPETQGEQAIAENLTRTFSGEKIPVNAPDLRLVRLKTSP